MKLRSGGQSGRITVKITRENLMEWVENFVDDFNVKETMGKANIILPCLTKVGQNCFEHDQAAFETWLTSLKKNALNKSLLEEHTAVKL